MTDDEFLWKLYEDNRRLAQVHEDRRSASTALIVGGGGALASAITEGGPAATDLWLAAAMIVLGYSGWLIAQKASERSRLHHNRSYAFLAALDAMHPNAKAAALKEKADAEHNAEYPKLHKKHLRNLWHGLNLLVAFAGVAMVFWIKPDWWAGPIGLLPKF